MSENKPCSNEIDIYATSTEKAHYLYGRMLPDIVDERLKLELTHIKENRLSTIYSNYYLAAKYAHDNGQPTMALGNIGSSLVAFLLDITNINPLSPHYLCDNCNYSEFINNSSVYSCYDLPTKTCPVCAKTLHCEGHNIPYETLIGADGGNQLDVRLCYPMSFKENMPHNISNVKILGYIPLETLLLLEKTTGVSYKNVNISDPKIYELFLDSRSIGIESDEPATIGLPEFGTKYVRNIIKQTRPTNFGELVRLTGLLHGTNVKFENPTELLTDNIPEWHNETSCNIRNILPKAHTIEFTKLTLILAWYKVYYPTEFYVAIFNTRYPDINLSFLCNSKNSIDNFLNCLVEAPCSNNYIESYDVDLFIECLERAIYFKTNPDHTKNPLPYFAGKNEIFINNKMF